MKSLSIDIETYCEANLATTGVYRYAEDDSFEILLFDVSIDENPVKTYDLACGEKIPDGRCRGLFQFYGANRTGRWAGRLIQLQNLYRNSMPDLDIARNIVKSGDYDWLSLMYDDVPDVLAQLIRTALFPKPGYKFVVSDFSSIEAHVLAYLAGETWKTNAFARIAVMLLQSRLLNCHNQKKTSTLLWMRKAEALTVTY